MELLKPGSLNIDFMGKRKFFGMLSLTMVCLALLVAVYRHVSDTMNYGIDFAGGTVIDMEFDKEVDINKVRKAVADLGYEKTVIQGSGVGEQKGKSSFLIRVERIAMLDLGTASKLDEGLKKTFGEKLTSFDYNADSGDQFNLNFSSPTSEEEVHAAVLSMADPLNKKELREIVVKKQGKEDQFRYLVLMTGVATHVDKGMKKEFPDANAHVRKVEFVGPQVGKKLRNDGIIAMIYANLGILIYVAFRFNFLFAPGAVLSLVHDAILTIGFFSLFRFEINLSFVAAVLTIIGYSVNDTIVIYDRIRENMAHIRSASLDKVINSAINDTLSRTILTSFVTALSLVGFLVIGFGETQDFAIAMLFGIVVGTYSSVYIAGALTIWIDGLMKKYQKQAA